MAVNEDFDIVVIGAGFAGMYALRRFRDDLGLRVRVYERGDDVGGTWYWNRYPGARCDVPSMSYSYSFSEDLEQEWEWTELYPAQPEILAYAGHVADRFDLRRDITFGVVVEGATFEEATARWTVQTDDGESVTASFLVTAVGNLSASRVPALPGLEDFTGRVAHTGSWPHEGLDVSGRRVAVVGTGSSGIQVIPQLAARAEHLTVFQRTPAYSLPARNRPLRPAEAAEVKARYRQLREADRTSPAGVTIVAPVGSALQVPAEQAEAELAARWERGGTAFMTTFTDSSLDPRANEVPAAFVRERIKEVVEDPGTAELLTPRSYPIGAKRICLDTGYFATYNRPNVSLVSVRDTPIERITTSGVVVAGNEHPVDVLVFATGYDAMTGPLNAIDLRGAGGGLLRDAWAQGPRTYLGIASAGFPNLFLLTGPGSPSVLANMFVSIEQHVDWVVDLVARARAAGAVRVEADTDDQDRWVAHVNELASRTLFTTVDSWYVGANVPGKPRVFMPYVGGMGRYRQTCEAVAADGYRGFTLTRADGSTPSGMPRSVPAATAAAALTRPDPTRPGPTERTTPTVLSHSPHEAPVGTRHLVDPELSPVLDVFPPLQLDPQTLPAVRAAMAATAAAAPHPQTLFPGVTRVEHTVPGADGDPPVRVLVYRPDSGAGTAAQTAAPALVWMHGGGFVLGDADSEDLTCRRLAATASAVVASVDYRLAPETPAPGPLDDCYAALRWVHEHAEELGVDRTRVALGGASAGGGLAACLAILARDRGQVPVCFQLLVYPMLDDRTASTAPANPDAGEFVWTPSANRFGWQALLGGEPGGEGVSPYAAAARVSDVAGLPPTYVCVGALDLFAEEGIGYATRLLRAGVPTELHVYPGAFHGFTMVSGAAVTHAFVRDQLAALTRAFATRP